MGFTRWIDCKREQWLLYLDNIIYIHIFSRWNFVGGGVYEMLTIWKHYLMSDPFNGADLQ